MSQVNTANPVDVLLQTREATATAAFARLVTMLHDPSADPQELGDAATAAGVSDAQLSAYWAAIGRERQLAGSLNQALLTVNDATAYLLGFVSETEHMVDELRRARRTRELEIVAVVEQATSAYAADLVRDEQQRSLKAAYPMLFWASIFPSTMTASGRAWYASELDRLSKPGAETPADLDPAMYRLAVQTVADSLVQK